MRALQLLLTYGLVWLFGHTAHAQDNRAPDPNNQFIYPPLPGPQSSDDPSVFGDDLSFTVGVAVPIPFKWTTNMTNYRLVLVQEAPPSVFQTLTLFNCGSHANYLYWDGSIGRIDITVSKYAYLGVYNCTEPNLHTTPIFFSHYFNLTAPVAVASTSSSMSSSSTALSSSRSSGSSSTTNTASNSVSSGSIPTSSQDAGSTATGSSRSSSSAAVSGSDSSSGKAAALGGGIGAGIGGATLLVGLGAAIIWWRRGKKKRARTAHATAEMQNTLPNGPPRYAQSVGIPSELHGLAKPGVKQTQRAELSSSNYGFEQGYRNGNI